MVIDLLWAFSSMCFFFYHAHSPFSCGKLVLSRISFRNIHRGWVIWIDINRQVAVTFPRNARLAALAPFAPGGVYTIHWTDGQVASLLRALALLLLIHRPAPM